MTINKRYLPRHRGQGIDQERYVYDPDFKAWYPLVSWFHACIGALQPPLERQCRGQYYVIGQGTGEPPVAILKCAKCGNLSYLFFSVFEGNGNSPADHDWAETELGRFPVYPQAADGRLADET